jgi:zinc transport system ATP-binding protein
MSHALVTIRNLRVSLGGHEVLRGVDADLARGGITALLGLNGAGKSTLLRALVKEVHYTGEVRFYCGHDHSRATPEHVGYVPQRLRIEANLPLTVLDLFGIALQRRALFLGVSRGVRARTEKLLAEVKAEKLLNKRVEKLSGGELQRVLLALAMEPRPELLLLDEPAAGIDFKDVGDFNDLITGMNRRLGVTVLLVSHDVGSVQGMVDHVLCLRDGRIHCQGPPATVVERLSEIFGAGRALYHHGHSHGRPEEGA